MNIEKGILILELNELFKDKLSFRKKIRIKPQDLYL